MPKKHFLHGAVADHYALCGPLFSIVDPRLPKIPPKNIYICFFKSFYVEVENNCYKWEKKASILSIKYIWKSLTPIELQFLYLLLRYKERAVNMLSGYPYKRHSIIVKATLW